MAAHLTAEQRWLLFAIGGWTMRDCLHSPAGTDNLMRSMYSSYGFSGPDGGPEWLTGWNTRAGKITAPARGDVRVIVTKAQINAYACTVPDDVRRKLTECRQAAHAERQRTQDWCHCPWQHESPSPHRGPCDSYHPSDDEDAEHGARLRVIATWQTRLLRRALRLEAAGEQLDLFSGLT